MPSNLEVGVVIAQVSDTHEVIVQLKTTGIAYSLNVKVPKAYADALRIDQKPLPGLGTTGLIAIPYGDPLNAVWLTAILPSGMDAIHAPGTETDANIAYKSTFSGHWEMLDGVGNQAVQWADGSTFTMAATSGVPQPMRHIVTTDNKRQSVPFTRSERIPSPPAPFLFNFAGADGIKYTTDGAGNAVFTATKLTLKVGGHSLVLDSNGLAYNGPIKETGDITATGNITAGQGGGDSVTLQQHKHPTAALGSPSAPTPGT